MYDAKHANQHLVMPRPHPRSAARLSAKRLEHLLVGQLILGLGNVALAAEDELRVELPRGRNPPRLGDLGVDQGVVVLEVGTDTLRREGDPEVGLLFTLLVLYFFAIFPPGIGDELYSSWLLERGDIQACRQTGSPTARTSPCRGRTAPPCP